MSFDFFDDCPSNSKTGHEQRRPADSPLRLIVVNLLQHVRTFAAYGLSSPIMWLWYSDMGFLRHRKRMSKSGLCIIFTYWFIIQVKDERKMQNGPHAKQRGSWYGISPVTRTMPNKKAYDRNDAKVLMKRDIWWKHAGWFGTNPRYCCF